MLFECRVVKMANLSATNNFDLHNVLEYGYTSVTIIQGRLHGVYSRHPTFTVVLSILLVYMSLVAYFRFNNVNRLKTKYGFSSDSRSFYKMTVEQAQEVQRNMAEWDFPALYEFGWIVEVFKVGGTASIYDTSVSASTPELPSTLLLFCCPNPHCAVAQALEIRCVPFMLCCSMVIAGQAM